MGRVWGRPEDEALLALILSGGGSHHFSFPLPPIAGPPHTCGWLLTKLLPPTEGPSAPGTTFPYSPRRICPSVPTYTPAFNSSFSPPPSCPHTPFPRQPQKYASSSEIRTRAHGGGSIAGPQLQQPLLQEVLPDSSPWARWGAFPGFSHWNPNCAGMSRPCLGANPVSPMSPHIPCEVRFVYPQTRLQAAEISGNRCVSPLCVL